MRPSRKVGKPLATPVRSPLAWYVGQSGGVAAAVAVSRGATLGLAPSGITETAADSGEAPAEVGDDAAPQLTASRHSPTRQTRRRPLLTREW
jgi:hypothetical protein